MPMSSNSYFEVAEAIHAVAIRILRIVRAADAKAEIGPAQLSALSVLVFAGPKTLGELADAEQVKAPTMSRIVQGLVSQGLANRLASPQDRRSVSIAATLKGRKLLLAGRDRRVHLLAERLRGLSDDDLRVLQQAARLLARL
jgi:DNA-binding MarR family transcriptional regulator